MKPKVYIEMSSVDHDEIIQEVRDNREAYAERFRFDIQALFRDAKKHEGADGRVVVSLKPHRIESASNRDISALLAEGQ